MITLPHSIPTQATLTNGWQQISFSLTLPFTLEVGARLSLGNLLLAPWRINGQHIDCLMQPNDATPDLTNPITLVHQGKALPHIVAKQPLLITGEALAIADAILAASMLKQYAEYSLILLSAANFPCVIKPARFMVNDFPELIAACPLLEDWGFANRLASTTGLAGCFEGDMATLLATLTTKTTHNQRQHLAFY